MSLPTYKHWIKKSRLLFYPRSERLQIIDGLVEQFNEQRAAPQLARRKTLTLMLHAIKAWEAEKGLPIPMQSKRWEAVKGLKQSVAAELQRLKPPPVPARPAAPVRPPAASPTAQQVLQAEMARRRQAIAPDDVGGATEMQQEEIRQHLRAALTKHRMKLRAVAEDDYETLKEELSATQFSALCAGIMLCVPPGVGNPSGCRREAIRILTIMMGANPEIATTLLSKKVEVVVVPKSMGMTKLPQFSALDKEQTFDGRSWDTVRGVGNVYQWWSIQSLKGRSIKPSDMKNGRILLAITEENLMGTSTSDVALGGCYARGYSTTTHEFAHVIHLQALTKEQSGAVDRAYALRQQGVVLVNSGGVNQVYHRGALHQSGVNPANDADVTRALDTEWVDGPRRKTDGTPQDCYAAMSATEYFAQCVNAWLGTNAGNDPYTGRNRKNGREWLLSNEPKMMTDVLQWLFSAAQVKNANENWMIVG